MFSCCRERIIHTLALKPQTAQQLLGKLRNEGLSDEAVDVTRILNKVACSSAKGSWALRAECVMEVDVNWAFYSETDKQLVKRYCLLPVSDGLPACGITIASMRAERALGWLPTIYLCPCDCYTASVYLSLLCWATSVL